MANEGGEKVTTAKEKSLRGTVFILWMTYKD